MGFAVMIFAEIRICRNEQQGGYVTVTFLFLRLISIVRRVICKGDFVLPAVRKNRKKSNLKGEIVLCGDVILGFLILGFFGFLGNFKSFL